MLVPRLSYEDSCRRLQESYIEAGVIPPIPDHLPHPDDEVLGVSFFRTFVGEGDDLSNLTLPRTLFARSEIDNTLFQNTDFTESNLCWNDFTNVNFTNAILDRCDLRSSVFTQVKFVSADLTNADMRLSSFDACEFTNAVMAGTVLTHKQGEQLSLSDKQRADIAWAAEDGPEPSGG